jgi:predicted ester cyclase
MHGFLTSFQDMVRWVHLSKMAKEVYDAIPGLHADVDRLIVDIEKLLVRLRG